MIRLDDARLQAAEAAFRAVVDLTGDARRAALLERCGSDSELRTLVEQLLAFDADASSLSQHTLRLHPSLESPRTASAPDRIGRYRILREIGRGGVGVVYEARQENPRRLVALKVLRFAAPSAQVLRRFQLEAEALGQLNHPGIAQVYEAGVEEVPTPSGDLQPVPYVAMELIRGRSLVDFAADAGLDRPARLELLAQVCDAVQHAHQKGVVHRDLKPGNILVSDGPMQSAADPDEVNTDGSTLKAALSAGRNDPLNARDAGPDSRPTAVHAPKVVDFGVARVSSASLLGDAEHTQAGQLLGTIAYMSPEQLGGDPHAVDTRSDIYSLGVVGYELLTGRPPVDVAGQSLPRAIRMLAEAETPAAGSIRRDLRGDVEAILAKAMEKSPDRRYGSAVEMGADIRRHLRREPIAARPATFGYAFGRFLRRRRLESALLGTIVLLVCGSTAALAALNWRAVRGWQEAEAQSAAADTARRAEHDARTSAESVSQFLHDMLAAASPAEMGRDASLLTLLRSATGRLEAGELSRQPVAAAAALTTIGTTWQALGDLGEAEAHFDRALQLRRRLYGEWNADVATTLNHLGESRFLRGDLEGATQCFNDTLSIRRRLFGEQHPGIAECHNNLAFIDQSRGRLDSAEQHLREALRIWRATLGEQDANVELGLHNLASILVDRGMYPAAEPLLREVYSLRLNRHGRDDHPLLVSTRNNLAICLEFLGRFAEALQLHERNLEINRRTLPAGHINTRSTVGSLANALRGLERFEDAERLLRDEIGDASLDEIETSPSLADLYSRLGLVLTDLNDPGAEPILRRVAAHYIDRFGDAHQASMIALNNLADALADRDDLDGALACMQRVLAIEEQLFGSSLHARRAIHRHHLARVHQLRQECDQAEALFREALEIRRQTLGERHPLTQSTAKALAGLLTEQGREEEAVPLRFVDSIP